MFIGWSFEQPEVTSTSACLLGFISPLECFALPRIVWPGKNNAVQTHAVRKRELYFKSRDVRQQVKRGNQMTKDVNSLFKATQAAFLQTSCRRESTEENSDEAFEQRRSNSKTELALLQRRERIYFVRKHSSNQHDDDSNISVACKERVDFSNMNNNLNQYLSDRRLPLFPSVSSSPPQSSFGGISYSAALQFLSK